MSRNPDEEKRRRILDTALKSFCDIGYKSTTIKIIADAAQIAPGSIYTYFVDKKALYTATIEDMWNTFFLQLDKLTQAKGDFLNGLAKIYEQAAAQLFMSHSLLNDMFTNKGRKDLLRKNLGITSRILAEQFINRPGTTVLVSDSVDDLSARVEIFLFGAFFQLALSSHAEFPEKREKLKQTVFSILSGTCV